MHNNNNIDYDDTKTPDPNDPHHDSTACPVTLPARTARTDRHFCFYGTHICMHICHTECRHARAHAWTGSSDQVHRQVIRSGTRCQFLHFRNCLSSSWFSCTRATNSPLFSDPKILIRALHYIYISPYRVNAPPISGIIIRLTSKFVENKDARTSCHSSTIVQKYHRPKHREDNQANAWTMLNVR